MGKNSLERAQSVIFGRGQVDVERPIPTEWAKHGAELESAFRDRVAKVLRQKGVEPTDRAIDNFIQGEDSKPVPVDPDIGLHKGNIFPKRALDAHFALRDLVEKDKSND